MMLLIIYSVAGISKSKSISTLAYVGFVLALYFYVGSVYIHMVP